MSDEQLTVDDLISKGVDEIANILTEESKDLHKTELKEIKKHLKTGVFKEEDIVVGNEFSLSPDVVVKITKVLPSTGRVFFKFENKEFSLSKSSLIGEVATPMYQIGYSVLYLPTNEIGIVIGIIKSSNKYRVKLDNEDIVVAPLSKLQVLSNI